MRGLLKKALTRKIARKGSRGKEQIIVISPSERLVVGVKFAVGMIGCLSSGIMEQRSFCMYFGFDRHCLRSIDRTTGLELVEKIFPERG